MKQRRSESRILETMLSTVAGFAYFFYMYTQVSAQNPHLVFFSILCVILILSYFMNQKYFASVFALTSVVCWIIVNTEIMLYVRKALYPLGIYIY